MKKKKEKLEMTFNIQHELILNYDFYGQLLLDDSVIQIMHHVENYLTIYVYWQKLWHL